MEKNLILTRAKDAVLAHDFVTAARLYKMLLADDPSNVEYLKQLGSIYVQNQEDEKAIPYYEQIITFYPHYVDAMTSLGAIYRRLGRYEESIEILQRAVDEGRDTANVNYNLGFTYKEMGNFDDAIDAFNLVVHENPDDVLAYNHLGRIYFAQKNYEKAIASYKRGLQIDQNHPILNYNLAHVYEVTKNNADAIRCYQSALKTRPGWVDAISDFSELLIRCQNNKEAQDLVQQSIKLHPTNGDLLCLLGRVYLNQYDYAAAEKTFKQADAYKANDVKILTGLSEALEKGEKVDAALDTVLSALEIEPENKDIRKQYVHTLLTAKDYDEAQANIKALYDETEGKDLSVLDLYGQYYICKDQEEQAQQFYNKIKTLNHHYKDYMLGAASRFSQIGKYDKAESYANEFIERRPSNPEGYNVLGKIFEHKGDLHKAIDSYSKSLNLRRPNVLADKKIAAFKTELEKNPVPEPAPVEPAAPVEAPAPVVEQPAAPVEKEPEEEEFDYTMLGGNVPLQEGLVEEEKDFFDTLDEENDSYQEEEAADKKADEKDVFDDDGIFDDEASRRANPSLENGLKNADSESAASVPSLADAAADEDFDIFGSEPAAPQSEAPDAAPQTSPEPLPDYNAPASEPAPAQSSYDNQDMQQMAFDNAANAMNAAIAAQKMAQELADQQWIMHEQTQQALQDALEKVQNLQEEQMKEQDRKLDSLLDDSNITDETPVEETLPEAEPEAEVPDFEEPAEFKSDEEVPEEEPVEEEIPETEELTPADEPVLEPEMETEPEAVLPAEEEMVPQEPSEDAFADDDILDEFAAPEAVQSDAIPEDDFELDLGDNNTVSEFDLSEIDGSDELNETLREEMSLEGDLPPETEAAEPEGGAEEAAVEAAGPEEEVTADDMLEKIERILSDDTIAAEYTSELELFKKLKVLSDYLPESEKTTFNSCRMRMLIEYIISKMSGKPGLLNTAVALIKSGVLGEDYSNNLESTNQEIDSSDEIITNEMISSVLKKMKKMAASIADKTLADAMAASVDNILERIEIVDQKSQIF